MRYEYYHEGGLGSRPAFGLCDFRISDTIRYLSRYGSLYHTVDDSASAVGRNVTRVSLFSGL